MLRKIISSRTICTRKGFPVILQEIDNTHASYCVQYAGNGHYFKTLSDAYDYMRKRRFIK